MQFRYLFSISLLHRPQLSSLFNSHKFCNLQAKSYTTNNYNNIKNTKMARILEPNEKNMQEAAELIQSGGLVSFPTETGINKL